MAPNEEDLEQALRHSLDQIEDAADLICRGLGYFDPDRVETALDSEAGSLRNALARLMEEPGDPNESSDSTDNLAALAAALARRIDPALVPLRLEVSAGELPTAAGGLDELRAAVQRLLQIGVVHAGSGGVVTVDPRTIEGDPALELVARPATGSSATSLWPPTARFRSLAEFVGLLGGGLELVERDRNEISAVLRFPRGSPE